MRDIAKTALFISLPFSLVVGLVTYIFTLNLVGVRPGVPQTYYEGLDAVHFMIQADGLISYLYNLLPQFAFYFGSIFSALVIQGYIYKCREYA